MPCVVRDYMTMVYTLMLCMYIVMAYLSSDTNVMSALAALDGMLKMTGARLHWDAEGHNVPVICVQACLSAYL